MPADDGDNGGRMRLAVIGDPIDHSLSPAMHEAALRAAGIEGSYVAWRVTRADLPSTIELLREQMRGCNVTIPYKETVAPLLDSLAPSAAVTAAVNTVVNDSGKLTGHNTDVAGFASALETLRISLDEQRAVIFGSGGAARAVVRVLLDGGASVTVVNRSPERAHALAIAMGGGIETVGLRSPFLTRVIADATMIVNATPLGMKHLPTDFPLPSDAKLESHVVVVDLVYGRLTPLLRQARKWGCRTMDGLEMLVQQGGVAFHLWTGVEPNLDVMRGACRDRLGATSSDAMLPVTS